MCQCVCVRSTTIPFLLRMRISGFRIVALASSYSLLLTVVFVYVCCSGRGGPVSQQCSLIGKGGTKQKKLWMCTMVPKRRMCCTCSVRVSLCWMCRFVGRQQRLCASVCVSLPLPSFSHSLLSSPLLCFYRRTPFFPLKERRRVCKQNCTLWGFSNLRIFFWGIFLICRVPLIA